MINAYLYPEQVRSVEFMQMKRRSGSEEMIFKRHMD